MAWHMQICLVCLSTDPRVFPAFIEMMSSSRVWVCDKTHSIAIYEQYEQWAAICAMLDIVKTSSCP